MSAASHSEGRILCVAPSLRSFPAAVRAWLSKEAGACELSPDLYDALALLAAGRRPEWLIVDIDVVDWNEMEFFRQAGQLGRQMRIFVTGPSRQQAKLEAACTQGALCLDARAVADMQRQPAGRAGDLGHGGLLAGSLRSTPEEAAPPADGRTPKRRITTGKPAIKSEPRPEPPVRLVVPSEQRDDVSPVIFPWSPNPNRPQRTPPQKASSISGTAPETGEAAVSGQSHQPDDASARPPVELTSEEIDALMGRPPAAGDEPKKERRQC